MTRKSNLSFLKYAALTASLSGALWGTGCKEQSAVQPSGTGSFDAAKYVAIGNSITAGFQSGSVWETEQRNAYPVLIAKQAGEANFQAPWISNPGIYDLAVSGRAEFFGLKADGTPDIRNNSVQGALQPSAANLPRPYNNLGVPGITIANAVTTSIPVTTNRYFDLFMRFRGSPVQQAIALQAQFVSFWLGNNDILGYATSGGFAPATDTAAFGSRYRQALDSLKKIPNVKIALANIPDVSSIPFFTTAGAVVRAQLQAAGATQIVYQRGFTATPVAVDKIQSGAADQIFFTLLYSGFSGDPAFAVNIGAPGGGAYRYVAQVAKIPVSFLLTGIDTTQPFGVTTQNPIPTFFILDDAEIAFAQSRTAAFNAIIAGEDQARAEVVGVVDANALLAQVGSAAGVVLPNGETLRDDYVSGGAFSLDGVHPSAKAHGVVANEFIKIINREFGANLPLITNFTVLSNGVTLPTGSSASVATVAQMTKHGTVPTALVQGVLHLFGATAQPEPAGR